MQSISPYLYISPCREALTFYEKALGGTVRDIQMSDGIQGFEGQEGKVLHAVLDLGENKEIHFSDVFGDINVGTNVQITIECETEEEIRRIYQGLSEKGKIKMELQDTFWGALHANVIDPFGVIWLLNYQK